MILNKDISKLPTSTSNNNLSTPITVCYGDGIGPEIMKSTLRILKSAGARIETDMVKVGKNVYESGNTTGIDTSAWDSIRKNKIFLKAPITTPQGGGYKSLNVTLRKTLGLFANVRPCKSYHPFVTTNHPDLDIVVIRENEEDLYAGIEHQQTNDVVQCLKLISRPGCERIIRYAFEYTKSTGRKKVTCLTKDNIMKQTDGLFHKVFDEIRVEYPEIISNHLIVDIGTALIANHPEDFDVVVLPNLYGDIVSDVTSEIAGSVGLGGSANIGKICSMFEAIHGSAPDIAGKGIANPSGLINGSIMMLEHIGQYKVADKIRKALLKTIEDGIHTVDLFKEGISTKKVGTEEFADTVIDNLSKVEVGNIKENPPIIIPDYVRKPKKKSLKGVDVFIDWQGDNPNEIGEFLHKMETVKLKLSMITNRGVKVYPNGFDETFCTDHWRCRFVTEDDSVGRFDVLELLGNCANNSVDVIKTEYLFDFDGQRGYSLGQGQ